jgi:aryl-alcohol dehydrogenase-like predicted oxidoreductase
MDTARPARALAGHPVYPIGFGAMLLTLPHPPPGVVETPIPDADAIRTIHAALDGGARVIDTAINYCMSPEKMGDNEDLVGRALASWGGDRESVVVVAKGGNRRTKTEMYVHDGPPEHLRRSVDISLRGLRRDALDLYLLHAPDPAVPLQDSFACLAELQALGKIRAVGASNLSRRQLAEVRTIVDIVAVENELSTRQRKALNLARQCADDGIAFLAYMPLGGQVAASGLATSRPVLAEIAAARDVSSQQIALAWIMAQTATTIPIPSARRPTTIADSLQAATLELTDEELARIDAEEDAIATAPPIRR